MCKYVLCINWEHRKSKNYKKKKNNTYILNIAYMYLVGKKVINQSKIDSCPNIKN